MSERIFEALAIVSLNGFGEDIKSCAYLNKSTYNDPYFLDTLGANAYPLLMGAAAVEDVKRMEWILDNGRMPKLPLGRFIMWCMYKRHQNSTIWLMERFNLPQDSFICTADMTNGFFPLVEACRTNQTRLAMWLLDHGVDPNIHPHVPTPLVLAARINNLELFNMLLARGADINFMPYDYKTVAWHAVCNRANSIVDRCIELGCYNKDVSPRGITINSKNIITTAQFFRNDYAVERLTALQKSLGFA